jgi:hypothetical protein
MTLGGGSILGSTMALFLTKGSKKPKGKADTTHTFYVLRENRWDREAKAQRQRHVAYIGVTPEITQAKAERICREKGITMDQLRRVRRLRIVEAGAPAQ